MTVVVGEKELVGMAVVTERRLAYRPAELAAMVRLSAKVRPLPPAQVEALRAELSHRDRGGQPALSS